MNRGRLSWSRALSKQGGWAPSDSPLPKSWVDRALGIVNRTLGSQEQENRRKFLACKGKLLFKTGSRGLTRQKTRAHLAHLRMLRPENAGILRKRGVFAVRVFAHLRLRTLRTFD